MKLLTEEIRKALPPLYGTEKVPADEKVAVAKFFSIWGNFTWYAVEGGVSPATGEYTFFGYVVGLCPEWGYFTLRELEECRLGRLPLVERDVWWTPAPMAGVLAGAVQ